jgi:4-azaleucine resistance transporter AzlC
MPASRRDEFAAGLRAELPLLLGVAPFGIAFGAYAVERGISSSLAQSMSLIIFGGASQFVAVQAFAGGTAAAVIVLMVALVNSRHLLYSAALAPRLDHVAKPFRALLAYLLTDEAYVVTAVRFDRDDAVRAPHRHWFLFGAGVALWVCWQLTTAAGVLVGEAVPESWSLDFALPLTFIAVLVPALDGAPALAAVATAAAVALAGDAWPYETGLLAAAVSGIAAGLLAERLQRSRTGDDAPARTPDAA